MFFNQKFEPKRGILHGAGQSLETFERYAKAIGNLPSIYMLYIRINEIPEKFPKKLQDMQNFSNKLIPQIGLNLKAREKGSQCAEIIKGTYDKDLNFLINLLKETKNPVFLRIGYEFNNPSHGYNPEEYKKAYTYVVNLIRKNKADNIAFIWCACAVFNKKIEEIMQYYPGDEYVDWFGNDLFNAKDFKDNKCKITEDFSKESENHKKPLMICESSAARTGIEKGEESWSEWFKPYFDWINSHEVVKAFCYINYDWGKDWKTPEWRNCRIEENEYIKEEYKKEVSKIKYISLIT